MNKEEIRKEFISSFQLNTTTTSIRNGMVWSGEYVNFLEEKLEELSKSPNLSVESKIEPNIEGNSRLSDVLTYVKEKLTIVEQMQSEDKGLDYGRPQFLTGLYNAYEDIRFELEEGLFNQPDVDKVVCDSCRDVQGMYLGTTCPKCNRCFRSVI